jgi:hypothetical protein
MAFLRKTLLQQLSLAAAISSTAFSVAASIPKTIQPDNVVLCEPNAGCVNKTIYGRNYKVISTPRFTVMVAVSQESGYTRADVSVANNTGMPLSVTPEDFRVEVLTPKPKVLPYIPPSGLNLPPVAVKPAAAPAPKPAAASPAEATQASDATLSPDAATAQTPTPNEQQQAAQLEAIDKVAVQQHLAATSIQPNEVTRGRVYFASDKHARLVNVVLPIAGVVFEFPYAMKKEAKEK